MTTYLDEYCLLLINFITFCQSINIDDIKLKGEKRSDIYTYLICRLFNIYITEVGEDILNWDIVIPEFFNKDKFRINKEVILNKITKEHLLNPKFEYIFKCIYFSMKNKIKEPFGVISDSMLVVINKFIDDISSSIDKYLNKKSELEIGRKGLVNFGDWFDLDTKIDKDGEGNVYPTILDEIRQGGEEKKKKKEPVSKGTLK
jgi:hypothetical protein